MLSKRLCSPSAMVFSGYALKAATGYGVQWLSAMLATSYGIFSGYALKAAMLFSSYAVNRGEKRLYSFLLSSGSL